MPGIRWSRNQTFITGIRRYDFDLRLLEQALDNSQIHHRIVDDENSRQRRGEFFLILFVLRERVPERLFKIAERLPIYHTLLHFKAERRALPVNTFNVELRVHQSEQLLRDVHSESGAFDRPIALFFNALECAEQFRNVFFFDADARILDRKPQQNFVVGCLLEVDGQRNGTFFRVFDGVGQDVCDDLFETNLVAVQHRRQLVIGIGNELQALLIRTRVDHVDEIIQQRAQLIIDVEYLHLAGFDL